jgi:large subunit ribosomal protein L15
MKGQKARAGGGTRLYFTGGNLPFYRRLPYVRGRGMRVLNRTRYNEVNLDQLTGFEDGNEVSPETLQEAKLLRDTKNPVAILGRGSVSIALKIRAHRISAGARSKVEAAGGSVELIEESGADR